LEHDYQNDNQRTNIFNSYMHLLYSLP
jgi:hypothetical protein